MRRLSQALRPLQGPHRFFPSPNLNPCKRPVRASPFFFCTTNFFRSHASNLYHTSPSKGPRTLSASISSIMSSLPPTNSPSQSAPDEPKPHKLYTLILPVCLATQRVVLGYKKRGFGVGKYNGFGGKVEADETIVAGAARELMEESGMVVTEEQLVHRAILLLETTADGTCPVLEIHLFVCTEWSGEMVETDEMRPEYFPDDAMPLDEMWEETRHWMRTLLQGVYFTPPVSTPSTSPSKTPPTGPEADKRGFVHYVSFHGGENPQTREWDAWHGMGVQVLRWYADGVGGWGKDMVRKWVAEHRDEDDGGKGMLRRGVDGGTVEVL